MCCYVTQAEFYDEALLQYAVQMTHALDARFGLPPKAVVSQVGAHQLINLSATMIRAATWGSLKWARRILQ